MNDKEVLSKLQAAGWVLDRVNGSHHVLTKNGIAVPVPVHGTRDLGAGQEEALFNASEVLSAMLAWRLDEAKDVPQPSQKLKGMHYIAPDAKTQAAMLLRLARGERSLSELARALETSWPAAKRLEDPLHWPSLKTLDRAAAALGKRLVLSLE